jgi:hypothetical protein
MEYAVKTKLQVAATRIARPYAAMASAVLGKVIANLIVPRIAAIQNANQENLLRLVLLTAVLFVATLYARMERRPAHALVTAMVRSAVTASANRERLTLR